MTAPVSAAPPLGAAPLVLALPAVVAGPSVPRLRRALVPDLRAGRDVVLDCREVQELSPAAQALLVGCSRLARLHGARLHLRAPSPAVVHALRGSGLSHLLVRHRR